MDTADLPNSIYQQKITDLIGDQEVIRGKEFEACNFSKCSFNTVQFLDCSFIDCNFTDCVFSAIKPNNCILTELTFSKSKVMGFDWTLAKNVRFLVFNQCDISYSNFSQLKLPKTTLIDSVAKEVGFPQADLSQSNLSGTDFQNSTFSHTNLKQADLRGAKNYYIDIKNNCITKAKFSYPEVMGLLAPLEIVIEY